MTQLLGTGLLVLVTGAVLAPGKRTVSQALRVMGLAASPGFSRYHEVLNRARWNGRAVACTLLVHVLKAFLPSGEVVIGVDDTIERRWGIRIKARGLYRDPVRSSRGHFVRASGLRWLSLMVMVPIPWAGRRWALPFLTVLAPSERWSSKRGRWHKTVVDWARQAVLQTKRWLSGRRLIVVADAGFSGVGLIAALRRHACLITRLRIDASLFAPAPPRRPGQMGRPRLKGKRLPALKAVVADPHTAWSRFQEVRTHLGVETQRQWSDLAILRTTPALLGLFSLVTVWADGLARTPTGAVRPRTAAWYHKREPTFSDAIAAVRRVLWRPQSLSTSRPGTDTVEIPVAFLQRLTDTLCHAT